MPDFETHFITGGFISALTNAALKKNRLQQISLGELIATFFTGGAVASLPDIIDPATNPQHRSIGHSLALSATGIPKLREMIANNPEWTTEQKEFLVSLLPAYGSHLVLDATTPAGLPLFG